MRKIYICIGLGLLFTACSTDAVMNETSEAKKIALTQHTDVVVDLIETIEKSCLQSSYRDEAELIHYVEAIAFTQTAFTNLLNDNYQKPTAEELVYIANTDIEQLLEDMYYSEKMKSYLYKKFVAQESWDTSYSTDMELSMEERNLLVILNSLEGDDEWDVRQIAFAYGYQSSKAKAVVLAVAVGQLNKIENR